MIGALVVTRDLQVETYQDRLNDPEILKIAKMVRMEADENMNSMDTKIQFIAKDGKVFEDDLADATFDDLILNWNTAVKKFHFLTGPILNKDRIEGIVDTVSRLDELSSISDLTAQLKLD